MNQNKRENRPQIMLEEIDFKKEEKIKPPLSKKEKFFKDLKKDISFISVVSVALFAVLGNLSVYMWKTNPPSVTYIPKQVNLSETDHITNTAYKAATNLLNFDSSNINNSQLGDYFYKNNFEQFKTTLKQIGVYDKVVNNKGKVTTDILEVSLMSKTIVHGMVRNIVAVPFIQTYSDNNEKTVTQGRMVLTIVENPDENNEFLISNTHIFTGETTSTLLK